MLQQAHQFISVGHRILPCCVNCGMTLQEIKTYGGRLGLFGLCSAAKGTRTKRADMALGRASSQNAEGEVVILEREL